MLPFILRERQISAAKRNPYRPHGQVKYGKWRTVARFADAFDAEAALRRRNIGLMDRAIFCRGLGYSWKSHTPTPRAVRLNRHGESWIGKEYRCAFATVRFMLWLNDVRDQGLHPIPL